MRNIPYSRQWINEDDVTAAISVLKGDWLTQGPHIEEFERGVAEYCGTRYAIAVSNGTAALHIACVAAELRPGDLLWTSPNTFVASGNCALYCGAKPDFVDIDPATYNMSVNALEAKLVNADKAGHLPKILIPVHFAGQPCEMARIHALGQKYKCTIIEDACHAIGAIYKGSKIGACVYSDMTVFSFHPVKNITTGEGGMVLTNRRELYERLLLLRNHGITRDPEQMQREPEGPWYYQQINLGFNYRMTDIQAALGTSQLKRLDEFIERRRFLAKRYNESLKDLPVQLPWQHPDTYSAYHLYVIRLKLSEIHKSRREVFDMLREAGIGVNVHYIPVHTQPYYQRLGFNQNDFPEAEKYYSESISLPLFYGLSETDQDYVIEKTREILK